MIRDLRAQLRRARRRIMRHAPRRAAETDARFCPETLADGGHAQLSQRSAALILQRALQPLVEVARGDEQLLERLLWRSQTGKHDEETEARRNAASPWSRGRKSRGD